MQCPGNSQYGWTLGRGRGQINRTGPGVLANLNLILKPNFRLGSNPEDGCEVSLWLFLDGVYVLF